MLYAPACTGAENKGLEKEGGGSTALDVLHHRHAEGSGGHVILFLYLWNVLINCAQCLLA